MPYGNGQGPNGMGPMTGRGAGYCAGFANAGYMHRGGGRRLGRSMMPHLQAPIHPDKTIIKRNLELQAEQLEAELGMIRDRLSSLNDDAKGTDQ